MRKLTPLHLLLIAIVAIALSSSTSTATVSPVTGNKYVFNNGGSTVLHGSGTYAPTITIPTDQVERLRATAIFSSSSGGHLQYGGSVTAEYVVQNSNGTLTAVPAATNSFNPTNSSTTVVASSMTGEFVQATNTSALNGTCSLGWSVSGTTAVLTFTNASSATDVYVTIYVDTLAAGST